MSPLRGSGRFSKIMTRPLGSEKISCTKRRGNSRSLEIPLNVRFLIESKLFIEEELKQLEPLIAIPVY